MFEGGAWGVRIPLFIVSIPFIAGSILAITWVAMERMGSLRVMVSEWSDVRRGPIIVALVLFPLAIIFYVWGGAFDWRVRLAIAISVLQWILLAGGLQDQPSEPS